MPETFKKILFTNTVADTYLLLAKQLLLQATIVPMITTSLLRDKEKDIIETIEKNKADTWIFTSKNAVQFFNLIQSNISWQNKKIFTVGEKTALHFNDLSDKIIFPQEENAAALAMLILKHQINEVLFWCGNMRHETLPGMLKNHHVRVQELEVYKTIKTPEKITFPYDAVACLSSSAAESFFSVNTIDQHIPVFAIGQTTFETLQQLTNNKIVVTPKPHIEILLQTIHQYFYS